MEYTDIRVYQVPNLRQGVQQIFEANGFRVEWIDQYSGKVRGSKISRAMRGFYLDLKYYEFGFQISILQDQTAVIRVFKYVGDDKEYREIVKDIKGTLQDIYEDMIKNQGRGDATKRNQVAPRYSRCYNVPAVKPRY